MGIAQFIFANCQRASFSVPISSWFFIYDFRMWELLFESKIKQQFWSKNRLIAKVYLIEL